METTKLNTVRLKDGSEYYLGSAYFDGIAVDFDVDPENTGADVKVGEFSFTGTYTSGPTPITISEIMTLQRIDGFENVDLTEEQLISVYIGDLLHTNKSIYTSPDGESMEEHSTLFIDALHPNIVSDLSLLLSDMIGLEQIQNIGAKYISMSPDYQGEGFTPNDELVILIYINQSNIDSFSQDSDGNYVYTYGESFTLKLPSAGLYVVTKSYVSQTYTETDTVTTMTSTSFVKQSGKVSVGKYHIFDKTYLSPKLNNMIFIDNNEIVTIREETTDSTKIFNYYPLYDKTRSEVIIKNSVRNFDSLYVTQTSYSNDKYSTGTLVATPLVQQDDKTAWGAYNDFCALSANHSASMSMRSGITYFPDYTATAKSSTSKTITVDNAIYESAVQGNQGTVTFTYDGSNWTCDYSFPKLSSWDLSTVGITYPEGETPVANETITVEGYGHCLVLASKTAK